MARQATGDVAATGNQLVDDLAKRKLPESVPVFGGDGDLQQPPSFQSNFLGFEIIYGRTVPVDVAAHKTERIVR